MHLHMSLRFLQQQMLCLQCFGFFQALFCKQSLARLCTQLCSQRILECLSENLAVIISSYYLTAHLGNMFFDSAGRTARLAVQEDYPQDCQCLKEMVQQLTVLNFYLALSAAQLRLRDYYCFDIKELRLPGLQ